MKEKTEAPSPLSRRPRFRLPKGGPPMSDLDKNSFLALYRSMAASVPCLAARADMFLSDEACEKLWVISDRLAENARRFNLTSILAPEDIVKKHLVDSLMPLGMLLDYGVPVGEGVGADDILDVGTGAGFPLLPWACVLPAEGVTLTGLDGTGKKISHIRETAALAGLTSVKCVHGRAEELGGGKMRENYSVVTARAVASLPVLLELCAPFVCRAGILAAMKSHADEELGQSSQAAGILGLGEPKVIRYALPGGDERTLILYKKRASTPKKYPRPFAEIAKQPLV